MNSKLADLIEKIKELLMETPEYKSLILAEKEMEESDEVKVLSYKKDLALMEYNDALKIYNDKDNIYVIDAKKKLAKSIEILNAHTLVKIYNEKYNKFKEICNEISSIIFSDIKGK